MSKKHTGFKFPCHICKYKATLKGDLLRHKRSIHEGLRFTCDQCDFEGKQKTEDTFVDRFHE